MKIAALAKLLTAGNVGPKQLGALLEAVGMNVRFSELTLQQYTGAFAQAGRAAALPGARVMAISGMDKDGAPIEALLILGTVQKTPTKVVEKNLDTRAGLAIA